jgi:tRNA uridine 5-carbamoylmethylation protein Kti12
MKNINIQALPEILEHHSNTKFVNKNAQDTTITASDLKQAAIYHARRGNIQETASIISLYLTTQEVDSTELLPSATRLMHAALKNSERNSIENADMFRRTGLAQVAGNYALHALDVRREAAKLMR